MDSDPLIIRPLPLENASSSSSSSGTKVPRDVNGYSVNIEGPSKTICTVDSQKIASPPPPPPPLPPRISSKKSSSSPNVYLHRKTRGSVYNEVVDMWEQLFFESNGADITICTDDGTSFLAHSVILRAASPVFDSIIRKKSQRRKQNIGKLLITGVPSAAARMFIRLLYSSRYDIADMEKYFLHLLALSHAYSVFFIKKLCTEVLEEGLLNIENVIDVFKLARLCDVPRLSFVCFRLIINDFTNIAKTEGWRVMRESDPSLEQELVEAVVDADSKRQEKARKMEEDKVYGQLKDAMEALVHICRDGCRTIGPHDKAFDGRQSGPCNFPACKGLESLVRHFASCKVKVQGGCVHCKRMWQLLELHSRMCEESDSCRVPLCRHFKEKLGQQSKKDEIKWKLLVSKVMNAKQKGVSFSLATVTARLEQD